MRIENSKLIILVRPVLTDSIFSLLKLYGYKARYYRYKAMQYSYKAMYYRYKAIYYKYKAIFPYVLLANKHKQRSTVNRCIV